MKILKLPIAVLLIIIANSLFNKTFGQNTNFDFFCRPSSINFSDLSGPNAKGFGHTPKGNLNIVFVYVTFIEDDNNPNPDDLSSIWPKNSIPSYAIEDVNGNSMVVDRDFNSPSNYQNLSKWFRVMSNFIPPSGSTPGSGFIISGKIFQVQISKQYDPGTPLRLIEKAYYQRTIVALNSKYPNEDWSNFDNRKDNPFYQTDNSNSIPDGNIDYLTINFRMTHDQVRALDPSVTFAGGADLDMFQGYPISNSSGNFSFNQGHTLLYYLDIRNYFTYFLHEFSHNLMQSLHHSSANSSTGQFYYCSNGWGMMGGINSMFQTINGWERRQMGWVTPQTITQSGTYYLKDFVTENDCIRIPIPNSEGITGNGGNPEYLYIEAHLLINHFDSKPNFNDILPSSPGIYAYTVRKDLDTRPIYAQVNSNPLGNQFKILSKAGNWDHSYIINNNERVISKQLPNDIGGQNLLQALRFDLNSDNIITYGDFESNSYNEMEWVSNLDGVKKPYFTGSSIDAFVVGDEISISGNVPALNYNNFNAATSQRGGSAMCRGFYLNGLSVKINSYNSTTQTYEIIVDFNSYELKKDARWGASNIYLQNLTNDNNPDLIIESGTNLSIDRSHTPNSDLKELDLNLYPDGSYMANPGESEARFVVNYSYNTRFRIESYAKMLLKPNSTVNLIDETSFILKDNSELEIQEGAVLSFFSKSKLVLPKNSKIIVKDGGKIIFNPQSTLENTGNCTIILEGPNSVIEFKDQSTLSIKGIISDPTKFTYSGQGYIIFRTTTSNQARIISNGEGCQFSLKPNNKQKVIELFGDYPLEIPALLSKFEIENGVIVMNENSSFNIKSPVKFNSADFVSNPNTPLLKHKGITLYGQKDIVISGVLITNATRGLTSLNNVGNNPIEIISLKTINCDFGFYCLGKGVTMFAGEFHKSANTGLYLEGQDLQNNLYSITCKENLIGAQIIGSKGVLTRFYYPNIEFNGTGIVAINSNITANCGIIRNSGGKNVYVGWNSTFDIDPNQIIGSGYIDFSNTSSIQTPILIKLEYSGLGPFLNNSKSNFISTGFKIKGFLQDIYNTQLNQTAIYPNILPVNHNYWMDNPTFGVPYTGSHTDVNYRVYDFSQTSNFIDKTMIYRDNTALTASSDYFSCNPFNGNQFASIFIDLPEKQTLDEHFFTDVFRDGVNNLYGSNPNYGIALENFTKILKANYSSDEIGPWGNFVTYNFNKITESFAQMMSDTLYSHDEQFINLKLAELSDIYSIWDIRFNNYKTHQFDLSISKLLLNKINGNYSNCQSQISLLYNNVKNDYDLKLVNYYDCLIHNQMNYSNGSSMLTPDEIINHCANNFPNNEENIPTIEIGKRSLNSNQTLESTLSIFSIFPNPAIEKITIGFNSKYAGEKFEIEILDLLGKTIFKKQGICEIDNYINLEIPGIMPGQYFVKLIVGSNVKLAKLMITK